MIPTTEVKEALIRMRTADAWQRRLNEISEEYRRAYDRMNLFCQLAADSISDLMEAAEAPVREAPRYCRQSRPLPFEPGLIVQDFMSALRRRGILIEIRDVETHTEGGEYDDTV